ncbi:MAG: RNA polymerase sigma factor [Bacteroidales bacterium]|nr:RNA polymerase sigma factor [Bacteroidales bacterium]
MNYKEYNSAVDLYSDKLYRFVLKITKDKYISEDIVQYAYEKLWLKLDSVNFEKAKSYLFTVAYNMTIDYIRKNKNIIKNEDLPELSYNENLNDFELQKILHNAINKLPPDQRAVLLLRDYEGYSYKEIEEITGLNESQVKVYIFRARKFLKEILTPFYIENKQ